MIKIDFNNMEFISGSLYSSNGEKFMDLSEMPKIEEPKEEKYEFNKPYKALNYDKPFELEINNNTSGTDLLKMLGIDLSKVPDKYNIQYIKIVQKRKHKKKRVNKKWLKQYGIKQMLVESKGWEVHTSTDGTFEFINRDQKEIDKITN